MEARLDVPAARTLSAALDLHTRVCMGQLEIVEETMRHALWQADERLPGAVQRIMGDAKAALGQPSNGSWGVGSPAVHISGKRAWEMKKVLDKAIVEERGDPSDRHTVRSDGLTLRYTQDEAPVATASPGAVHLAATDEQWEVAREALDLYRAASVGDVSFLGRLCEAGVVGRREEVARGNAVSRRLEAAGLAEIASLTDALATLLPVGTLPDDPDGSIALAREAVDVATGAAPRP